mmetsp:Transcript_41159/g.78882  ORF Transcript_41159/g.78882 Transcript_41159/m.78882 type:complete len:258 (-) Transcript_41159:131-904(-)
MAVRRVSFIFLALLTSGNFVTATQQPALLRLNLDSQDQLLKPGAACSACVQLGSQGINLLLNYILQGAVVGSCGKLCSRLPKKAEQVACNLACDIVGVKAFIAALNHTDLDPIFLCEEIKLCHAGNDTADVRLVSTSAMPTSIAKGGEVSLGLQLDVKSATGVGEVRISIDGPVTTPVSQSFLMPVGFPTGTQAMTVKLTCKDDESGDFPVIWSPGNYTFTYHVCQGECGSKHPHSKDFGFINGSFALTDGVSNLIV